MTYGSMFLGDLWPPPTPASLPSSSLFQPLLSPPDAHPLQRPPGSLPHQVEDEAVGAPVVEEEALAGLELTVAVVARQGFQGS